MISAVPSVSSVHVELDGRLPSTAGRTDETTKSYVPCDQVKCTVGDTVINLSRVDPRTVPRSTSRSELSCNHLPVPFPSSPSSCRVFWEGSHRGG
jgi:hypothetical protein